MSKSIRKRCRVIEPQNDLEPTQENIKKQSDVTQLDGQVQVASPIVMHTQIMALIIEFCSDPRLVKRLHIALQHRFWQPIASQVTQLWLKHPHRCCSQMCQLALQFCNLIHLQLTCYNNKGCCPLFDHIGELPPSLQSLYAPHVTPETVRALLGGKEERPSMIHLNVQTSKSLPPLPMLQSLHQNYWQLFDNRSADQICKNFTNLVHLKVEPCYSILHAYNLGRSLNFLPLVNLQSMELIATPVNELQLPSSLTLLKITADTLCALHIDIVLDNLQTLIVVCEFTKINSLARQGGICPSVPNLQVLQIDKKPKTFLRLLFPSPHFLDTLPRLHTITGDIVAHSPLSWVDLGSKLAQGRNIKLLSCIAPFKLKLSDGRYLGYVPALSSLIIENKVPLSKLPSTTVQKVAEIRLDNPYSEDWRVLSSCQVMNSPSSSYPSTSCLVDLRIDNMRMPVLTSSSDLSLSAFVSLNSFYISFLEFITDELLVLETTTKLIDSISSTNLAKLAIRMMPDITCWYAALSKRDVSAVQQKCPSLPTLLSKHSTLTSLDLSLPVSGLCEPNLWPNKIQLVNLSVALMNDRLNTFSDAHFIGLVSNVSTMRFAMTCNVSIIQPVWYSDDNSTLCTTRLPKTVREIEHYEFAQEWNVAQTNYLPSLHDPKIIIAKLEYRPNLSK